MELSNYCLNAMGTGDNFNNVYFALSKGDVCCIQTDSTDDAHNFLKALATLVRPTSGTYRYMGEKINLSDYRKLLPVKKKIGYIGQDATMVSNRTVRENLLLMRFFFENSLSISLDERTCKLCKRFNLEDKLDLRPGELKPIDLRIAIAIRELTKPFDVLLLDRPEDCFGYSRLDFFNEIFNDIKNSGRAAAYFSYDQNFVKTFPNRKILITDGNLTEDKALFLNNRHGS